MVSHSGGKTINDCAKTQCTIHSLCRFSSFVRACIFLILMIGTWILLPKIQIYEGSQSLQSQMPNQQLPIPMVSNQSQVRQQLLSQSVQNNISSIGVPSSAGLTSTLPPVGGMSQGVMPSGPGQNPSFQHIQNMSNVTGNVVGNSMGQGVSSNIYANSQRQITGRQAQGMTQEPQQQSENSQHYLYNQQLQQHVKQKFQQGSVQQPSMQSQIQRQQQNLLQQNQLQSSQQSVMQPSLRQTSASSTLQNQQTSLQQTTQSMLQQQSQSILRQQPQQPSVMHEQQISMSQHQMQQQQHLSGQQPNTGNMQHNQLIGQQNCIPDTKQQQKQRIIAQQNNISNMQQQQQQTVGQQNNLPNMHQHQSTGQQNNLPNMHHQQLGSQNNLTGQQQQMAGIQHGTSSLQSNQHSVHMLQQSKVGVQQQMPSNMANMLPNQAQQPQSQPMQQQLMSPIQSQPGQVQQQLGLQQQLLQPQSVFAEASLDSSSQTGNAAGVDWQEEIYQKIKSVNEMYFPELNELYQRMAVKLQQINQINDANDMKMGHQMGGKSGVLQPHNSYGQRQSYLHQQMKSGIPFSISSQQVLQATSPQIAHHSSPQIDQQNILTSHSKGGTPLQSANSPFIIPSPSSCMAPSPMLGDCEKVNSGVPALSNAGNSLHHLITAASMPNQSLAIGTPGISASPLLAECTSAEGTHGVASTIVSGISNVIKSMSPKALSASISDIGSVVSMVDRIAGSAPGNGSRAAVGEDLVAMTKCRVLEASSHKMVPIVPRK
ncbi:hypothetical protein OROGR_026602 [Orobanche gracilis]